MPSQKSEKARWDFPKKIEVIQQVGIVAPRILRKINKKRNELEHGYVKPTVEDVDDALDVATLFLAYSNGLANRPMTSYSYLQDFTIELKHKEGIVKLTDRKNNIEKIAEINDDDGWIEFAKRLSCMQEPASITFHDERPVRA